MRQTPSKISQSKYGSQAQPICMYYSGQKHQKILVDLYGNTTRQSIKHAVNHIRMNLVPIIDCRKKQTEISQQNSIQKLQKLKKLRQQTTTLIEVLRQQTKIKNSHQTKINQLRQLLQTVKEQQEFLAELTMKWNQLRIEDRQQKQNQSKQANDLKYQTYHCIYMKETQSILVSKKLQAKQTQINITSTRLKNLMSLTSQKKQQINQILVKIQQDKKAIENKVQVKSLINHDLKIVQKQLANSQLQVSVLKIQNNPTLRVGFSTVSLDPEGDRKRILEKNSNSWPKNKNKNLTINQIRDFLLIQLYPSWKKMLNRMSSQFSGFRELLCYQTQQQNQKIKDLLLYLPQKNPNARVTSSKTRSLIILYSPVAENNQQVLEIAREMAGLKNRVINISSVRLQQIQDNISQLQIQYEYLQTQRMKKIEVIILKTLSRQTLIKYLPNNAHDKIVLLKLEIPLIFNSIAQKLQYQQVYQLIRRCKC